MKKIFALVLSVILVLGLFVGCNRDAAEDTGTDANTVATTTGNIYEEYTPAGTLHLAFSGALEIVYDDEGNVLQITGTNEIGQTIAAACADQTGKGCVFAARKILRYASDNKLLGDAKSMVVRVGKGDSLPSEDFLDTIVTDCQYLADEECTGIQMMKVIIDDLDSDSNIIPEAARMLAARFLGVEESALEGDDNIVDGTYIYTSGDKGCAVDVFTGLVTKK